jgi:hypothetical protein
VKDDPPDGTLRAPKRSFEDSNDEGAAAIKHRAFRDKRDIQLSSVVHGEYPHLPWTLIKLHPSGTAELSRRE